MMLRPHFLLPFRFEHTRLGGAHIPVTEQDTPSEIADCVELALRTEQSDRRALPSFGRPRHLAFLTDRELVRAQIQQTIDDDEPRARTLVQRHDIDWSDPGMLRLSVLWEGET